MRTVVHGDAPVHYGQIYVHDEGGEPFEGDLAACFAGQRNGLCGAAVPGHLFLITGLHTGEVGFTTEVHNSEPPDARRAQARWAGVLSAAAVTCGDDRAALFAAARAELAGRTAGP